MIDGREEGPVAEERLLRSHRKGAGAKAQEGMALF